MRPLKYAPLWLGLGWLYAGVIVYLSLTGSPPRIAEFEFGDKLKHLAGYGLLMFWFSQLYAAKGQKIRFALGFVAMGIALEIAQGLGGIRTMEFWDAVANAAGVALGFWAGTRMALYKFLA